MTPLEAFAYLEMEESVEHCNLKTLAAQELAVRMRNRSLMLRTKFLFLSRPFNNRNQLLVAFKLP